MQVITECRACKSPNLIQFLDLGLQYLSDFRDDQSKTGRYPLVAVFCDDCKLAQLRHSTPQSEMYHERYGFKSGISDSIKKDLDDVVTHAFQYVNDPENWLDIASNDGTLLSYVPRDVYRVGVDPVKFLCDEAKQYADMIINAYFSSRLWGSSDPRFDPTPSYDVITSISCFYDMPDPSKFVEDVKAVLSNRGVWVIQQNYLLTTMELSAVDNFCHEHLEYYTLRSLENLLSRFDLEVNEVYLSTVNGGSIRTIVSHKGTFPVEPSVQVQRDREAEAGIDNIEVYRKFAKSVMGELDKLHDLVVKLHEEGKTIYLLAASTRGATIWQSARLDSKYISAAVERNPAKVGRWYTAVGVPIISEETFREVKPHYAIIGPWFFKDEIIAREAEYLATGGHLIIPLPKVEVL